MTTTAETITQIANDLVEHCKVHAEDYVAHDTKIWDKHFAESWLSIEGDGKRYETREAIIAKYRQWQEGVTVHGCEVSGPFVGQDSFSVIFDLDMEANDGSFPRMQMKEIGIYTVENGKIVKEEFCYQAQQCSE